ncbi:hypothetical protein Cgig2_023519 [Carnegiea gigantea]|uniref:Uncharacterized protein n=1 Tax=Carnegiea gigantea TaxID=171969 RepID=A0A9Q1GQE1_9CARY|nr:hypothetical protein Cgig2_023519 [Carnegiea gigantea]
MRRKIQSQQLQNQQQQQKSKFLPMLCSSSSTKEVKVSHRRCSSSSSSSASASVSVSEDPSSPRVGCMGQVKRNNKVIGFPSMISFTTSISASKGNNNSNALKTDHHISGSNIVNDDQKGCLVNLDVLDPPLPVVKLVQKQEEGSNGERMNLWKRRSGGAPLKSLQLQAIKQSDTLLSANSV